MRISLFLFFYLIDVVWVNRKIVSSFWHTKLSSFICVGNLKIEKKKRFWNISFSLFFFTILFVIQSFCSILKSFKSNERKKVSDHFENIDRFIRLRFSLNSYEGTYASVKSLLSRHDMHHVDLSETRKSPKG